MEQQKVLVNNVHQSIADVLKKLASADEQHPLKSVALYSLHYMDELEKVLINDMSPSSVSKARGDAIAAIQEVLNVELKVADNPVDSYVLIKMEKTNENDSKSNDSKGKPGRKAKAVPTAEAADDTAVAKPAKAVRKSK